jgi:hypothetical protein
MMSSGLWWVSRPDNGEKSLKKVAINLVQEDGGAPPVKAEIPAGKDPGFSLKVVNLKFSVSLR